MKKLYLLIAFFILLQNASFSQKLRKSMLSFTTGYVVGNNSGEKNNSSQFLIWGDYYFSNLNEISAVYKTFNLNKTDFNYQESFFAVKGLVNLFPIYLVGSYARLSGKYFKGFKTYNTSSGNFFSGEGIYYYKLFFLSLGGKYISYDDSEISDKLVVGFGELKWRPSLIFSVSIGTQIMASSTDSLYKSVNLDVFYEPAPFVNFTVSGFIGERKYNYDRKYLILYNFPEKETEAYSTYLRIFPHNKIGLILNYEKHFYDDFSVEYYSLSVKFNLSIGSR